MYAIRSYYEKALDRFLGFFDQALAEIGVVEHAAEFLQQIV